MQSTYLLTGVKKWCSVVNVVLFVIKASLF